MIGAPRPGQAAVVVVLGAVLAMSGCADAAQPGVEPGPGAGATSSTAGVSSPTGPTSSTRPTSPAGPTSAAPQVRTLEITVSNGSVTPAPAQVDLAVGETLRLVVTSDRDSEVHAHGFEIDAPVPAGQPTSVDVVGSVPGVYEVELHDPNLLLLQVAVR